MVNRLAHALPIRDPFTPTRNVSLAAMGEKFMNKKLLGLALISPLLIAGCTATSHFGVPDRAPTSRSGYRLRGHHQPGGGVTRRSRLSRQDREGPGTRREGDGAVLGLPGRRGEFVTGRSQPAGGGGRSLLGNRHPQNRIGGGRPVRLQQGDAHPARRSDSQQSRTRPAQHLDHFG